MRYNVFCLACDQVFTPAEKSPLWWKAKQRAEKGLLDALPVSGNECGCKKSRTKPEAPFRVFGYDDECHDFDIPHDTFVGAVSQFRELDRSGMHVVFIDGVSDAVRRRIEFA